MRMRLKKWARPELAVCPFFVPDAARQKGKWNEAFLKKQPLWVEMGCGKGGFLAECALAHPEVNFLGIDMISDMLGVARRKIQAAFDGAGRPVDNLRLTCQDISRLELFMGETDTVQRIFIHFCNPWNKPKQYKRRLTHPRQLAKYSAILAGGGEIWFKTDDSLLFQHSLDYFRESGFEEVYRTDDLHTSGFLPNIQTEHEAMYTAQKMKIKFVIVKKGLDSPKKFVQDSQGENAESP